MKVLVTGHRGYIGAEMVPALLEAGHDVTGLDIGFFDGCDFIAPPDDVPALHVDLRDVTPRELEGFDAVVHLAALSNDPLGDLDARVTYDINHHASVRLARAAKDAGVRRFLFSSSCSVYGAGGRAPLDENSALNPLTPYGKSKALVEQALSGLAGASFSPVYLRNATAYGVSRRLRADVVVNNLVAYACTTGKVLLESDGTPRRPLVHLRDIVKAFRVVLDAPLEAVRDQVFNVGASSENYRIAEIAELVADLVPDCGVAFAPGASADFRDYCANFDKLPRVLPEFRPTHSLRGGIEELRDAYRHGLTREAFKGPRYFRLRTVQHLRAQGLLDAHLRRTHPEPKRR
ncbi:MAG TPA: SDR family oxidoreductase [Polyangiaceae bacterium]